MTQIKALIFDKDGTLFDFAATWEAWAKAFLLRLTQGDRAKAVAVGKAIDFDLEAACFARHSVVIAGTPHQVVEALLPHFVDMTSTDLLVVLNEEAERAPQREAVALVPLLEGFRAAGLFTGVATNDAEQPARAHLAQAGVTHLFDFIAGYDSGFGGKPAPGQLLAFAAQINIAPDQIAMIGDSTHDLRAAQAAGMVPVGVLTGLAEADELHPLAEVVLPDIGHLPDWLATRAATVAR